MSHRPDQVASAIHRAVSSALTRLHDERIKGLVSVISVDVSPDFRQATVNVSVLPGEHARLSLQGLQSAAPRVQSELERFVRLRHVPRLVFVLDHSIKRAAELDQALAETRNQGMAPEVDDVNAEANGETSR